MFTLLAGWFWPPYAFILTFGPRMKVVQGTGV